jgi:hypothetical protein
MTAPGLGGEDPHPDEDRIVQTILEVIERRPSVAQGG